MLVDVCDCELQPGTGLYSVALSIDVQREVLYLFIFVFVVLLTQ
jgi:hypothetical protein